MAHVNRPVRVLQSIIHHHRRVRFLSTIELVNALEQEKLYGKQGRPANRLVHVDLLTLDELGYLPFSQGGGALLFHLLSKLYEKTSRIISTNNKEAKPKKKNKT